MAAIQTLHNRAVSAGTLKSTPQQKIEVQPATAPVAAQAEGQQAAPQQTIIIQPAEPNVVYVPQYNPSTYMGRLCSRRPDTPVRKCWRRGRKLYTIGVLETLVSAQREYARQRSDNGGIPQFARKIKSDHGKRDGLYWPVAANEPASPIGPLIAGAVAEGYQTGTDAPIPFHGYYYKVLTRQGPNAPGGAKNYFVNGKMTKGFAFLAYPAKYRASGVVTFEVNQDGVIVQKDLGPNTVLLANAISEFNPDQSWDQDIVRGEPQLEGGD
jgi:Protein of unknown function (DUF2950)/Protein of unknown function (DUF3300)